MLKDFGNKPLRSFLRNSPLFHGDNNMPHDSQEHGLLYLQCIGHHRYESFSQIKAQGVPGWMFSSTLSEAKEARD